MDKSGSAMMKETLIERCLGVFVKATGYISAVFLFILMAFIFADVIFRYFFNSPIVGGTELVEFLMAVTVSLSFGYGQYLKRHVYVEIFYQRLKGRLKYFADTIIYLFCFAIYLVICITSIQQAEYLYNASMTSQVLLIPVWPFRVILAIGCFIFCLAILKDIIDSVRLLIRGEKEQELH
jgi:TRAP-type C4-dicarboxylate transport system permease small subunit